MQRNEPGHDSSNSRDVGGASSPLAAPAFFRTEDAWAIVLGFAILFVGFASVFVARPKNQAAMLAELAGIDASNDLGQSANRAKLAKRAAPNPLAPFVSKLQTWKVAPADSFQRNGHSLGWPVVTVGLVCLCLFGIGSVAMGTRFTTFATAFIGLFLLATLAFLLASHEVVKHYNLEYPLWALLVGLIISNSVGTPSFLQPAVKTEFYIKTGIVLLGAKLLLGQLLALGLPGICISWLVTPVVLISTFWFGQRVLKIESPALNMTISADMSVCGVSAAIATAAACRAKKEELSTAVGLSLTFTAVMMIIMPKLIQWMGLSPLVGGAWLGGTIDATGAVAAAGAFLGEDAESVAITVKMIQNILIGFIAFGVATYWVTSVDMPSEGVRPDSREIWRRFPKFVLGFMAASIVFSAIVRFVPGGQVMVTSMIKGTSDVFRSWLFCLAFVSIGLATNIRTLSQQLSGGKPVVLYIVGQSLNLLLTLCVAWLMFEVVFKAP